MNEEQCAAGFYGRDAKRSQQRSTRRQNSSRTLARQPHKLSARELEVTSGNQLEFDYSFVDADTIDSVSVITNIHRVLPGAQVSLSYPIRLTVSIRWWRV